MQLKYQDLSKNIRSRKFSPVYLFTGTEMHIASIMEKNLISAVVPDGLEQINVMHFHDKETPIKDIIDICRQLPMMSEFRVVVLRQEMEIFQNSDPIFIDELCEYLKNPEPTTILIIYAPQPDKRKKIWKAMEKNVSIVNYEKLNRRELEKWISRRIYLSGKKTSGRVISHFIDRSMYLYNDDQNIEMIENEINKMIDYAGAEEIITMDTMMATLPESIDNHIFKMIDYAVDGRTDQALTMLRNFYLEGESPFGVFGLLAGQIRNISMVKILSDRKETASSIAKQIKRPGFVVQKMIDAGNRYGKKRIENLLVRLGDLDYQMKTGQIDPELGVELFIMNMK